MWRFRRTKQLLIGGEKRVPQPASIWKRIQESWVKNLILTHAFCLSVWKERTTWCFPFFSQPVTTDRDLGGLTLIRILTVCWRLSVSPGFCRLWSQSGVPMSLILVMRHWRGGKIFFFYALQWGLRWDPFSLMRPLNASTNLREKISVVAAVIPVCLW